MATYSVDVRAKVQNFQREMAKLPGITEEEASKAAVKLGQALEKGEQRAAAAAQRRAERAASRAAELSKRTQSRIGFSITAGDIANLSRSLVDYAQHIADVNNRLTDTSARTGIAVDTIKGLDLAFTGSGLSAENVESILNRFPKVLGDMTRGSGEAAPAFKRLGLEAADAEKMLADTDGGLREILKRLSQVPDTGERAALAMQIFGRQGGQILQSGLLSSADALDTFIGHADRWGVETGPQATEQAARFQRAAAELQMVLTKVSAGTLDAFGTDSAQLIQDFSAVMVAALEAVKASGTTSVMAMIALKDAVVELTGDGGVEGARAVFDAFKQDMDAVYTASFEAAKSFRQGQHAINDLGGAAEGTAGAVNDLGTSLGAQSGQSRAAAAAAREHAAELRSVEQALAAAAAQNEKFLGGDSIEAQRDRAIAAVDALAERTAAAGLATAENEQTLALQRLAIWEGYYEQREQLDATAMEEALKLREEQLAAEQALAEEQIRITEQVRSTRVQAGLDVAQNAVALADTLIDLAEMNAEATGRSEEEIARARKRAALFGAIVSTAQGVATALGSSPPPLNFINAGLVGAAGAAQIATIEGTQYHRGRAPSGRASDERAAMVQDSEAVLTTGATRRVLDALNRGEGMDSSPIVIRQQLGTKTLQTQFARASRQSGPVRRVIRGMGGTPRWRRS